MGVTHSKNKRGNLQQQNRKRALQKVTPPKQARQRATNKKYSELSVKTARIRHPKLTKEGIKKSSVTKEPVKVKEVRTHPPAVISLEDFRKRAVDAARKSLGKMKVVSERTNTPLYKLMTTYRKISSENPNYWDHFSLVLSLYQKRVKKETQEVRNDS